MAKDGDMLRDEEILPLYLAIPLGVVLLVWYLITEPFRWLWHKTKPHDCTRNMLRDKNNDLTCAVCGRDLS